MGQSTGSAASDEVILYVTATDRSGRSVGGLKSEHFKIREGGAQQEVTAFGPAEAPISIGIMIDLSGSTAEYVNASFDALARFVKESSPDAEFFVMRFNTNQELLVDWTRGGDDVLEKLRGVTITPKLNTALFDAMDAALSKVATRAYPRKAIIMFGDGMDNVSKNSYGDIKGKWRKSGVQLYTLCFRSAADAASQIGAQADSRMDELTKLTGGRAAYSSSWAELNDHAARASVELRAQYRIAFKPNNNVSNRKSDVWREVEVKIDLPRDLATGFGNVKARTRRGYYLGRAESK